MSYSVYCEEEYIWGPSLQVGEYFLGNVRMLENILTLESGVTSHLADTIEIDKTKLGDFVKNLFTYFEVSNNTPLIAMVSGTLEVLLALNAKVNGDYPRVTGQIAKLVERSKRVFFPVEDYLNDL